MAIDPALRQFSERGQRIEVVQAVGRGDLPVALRVLVGP